MQLILDTEPTVDIKRNMSTLNEEVLAEKQDDVIEDVKSGLCNGNKENIQSKENILSSIEESNTDNEKNDDVTTAKSPIPEQSADTILNPPNFDKSTEVSGKSPKPNNVTETASKSPKPDESATTENNISDNSIASEGTEHEKLEINMKDVDSATDTKSTEDISLRMEEDSPAIVDDLNENDEESDPIIITHENIACNGQDQQEISDKSKDVTDDIEISNVVVEKVEENVEIDDKQVEKLDENIEVTDKVNEKINSHISKEDSTCLNGLNENGGKIDENVLSINEENIKELVDSTSPSETQQEDSHKTVVDDVKMQDDIAESDTQSTSLQKIEVRPVGNDEHSSNTCDSTILNEKNDTDKSSDFYTNKMSKDDPKEIETVDLDDEDKENSEKSHKLENADSLTDVKTPIENGALNNESRNSVDHMETVDLIDEKDSSELESMDIDINPESGDPEEKPISLSSEKDDIFDCEENIDEVVPTEETDNNKTKNVELKKKVTPMDEDSVDDKKCNEALETRETINVPDDEVKEQESKNEESVKEITQVSSQTDKETEESKNIPSVLKLSNTLNILSDDEDELSIPPKPETLPKNEEVESTTENKCINIEDDDDIMLIDEEDANKDTKSELVNPETQSTDTEPKTDDHENEKKTDVESSENIPENAEKTTESPSEKIQTEAEKPKDEKDEKIPEAKTETIKPLVPANFLKTCKKNMAEMTRDDLEEFCILKIVESVVDRSSLSEIKSKLKNMAQCIEEYKKKAQMLQKQNRDLQVVLKTIQEEQKNSKTVTPLKITRSVGMQVLMTERSTYRRKPPGSGPNSNNTTPTKAPSPRTPNQRTIKVPASPSPQQIPVPRLVPANSPAAKNNMPQINATTSKAVSPMNGVRNNAQKAEKRGINRNHSVTVDLTDDEPPTKIMNRNSTPTPLRVVPPHMVPNLIAAPPRHPIQQNNNPRKVYIPISGPQNQNLRPGQAIMLKSVTAPNQTPRPRGPQTHMTRMPQNQVRMPRVQNRHPAPLPESTKQYPGTYLKALPPAPDLKLSKVENGIVISWKIEGYQEDSYEEIASYQLYAYQETNSPPSTALWKKIGDVKALPLPMACTLTQFMAGFKYYFAVRAVDIRSRIGPFSLPGSILLLNKL